MNNTNANSIPTVPPSGARGQILVIDNYDSFTYNLVHYLEDLDCEVTVYRNDEFELDEIAHFDKILLSPGPGIPDEAGLLKSVNDELLFEGLENEFEVGRYHSWVVDANLPDCLEATSFDENGQVMSLRHKTYDVRGVQFHPESVLTPNGKKMLENWVKR